MNLFKITTEQIIFTIIGFVMTIGVYSWILFTIPDPKTKLESKE